MKRVFLPRQVVCLNMFAVALLLAALAVFPMLPSLFAQETLEPEFPLVPEATQGVPQPPAADAPPKAPVIQPIPGGYFITFSELTSIGGLALRGPLAGNYELYFDTTPEGIAQPPQPPQNVEILVPLADYWIVRGKPERAIPIYERILKNDPQNLLAQNNLAMLLSTALENHTEALRIIDNALTERPEHVALLDSKGLILMNAGQPDQALPFLKRAFDLSCQGPIYALHYAKALDMVGDEVQSKEYFDRARPLLDNTNTKLIKSDQSMFDDLNLKYGTL